jgi:hypothetical protein
MVQSYIATAAAATYSLATAATTTFFCWAEKIIIRKGPVKLWLPLLPHSQTKNKELCFRKAWVNCQVH